MRKRIEELNRLYGNPRLLLYLRYVHAKLALLSGTWSELTLGTPSQATFWSRIQIPLLAAAYLQGNVKEADRYHEQAIALSGGVGVQSAPSTGIMFCWTVAIRAYVTGDSRWVTECAARMDELYHGTGTRTILLADFPICAARLFRLNPVPESVARDYYADLCESQKYFIEDEEYNIAGAKGLLALSWGDKTLAARHFEEAVAFSDKVEEKPWRAHYLFELALLEAATDRERSERLVEESRNEAERLHLLPLLERLGREWDEQRNPRPAAAAGNASSSLARADAQAIARRELDILNCLVEGLTYKEIAAFLNISRYTVSNHLRHIYEKTGSSNRGEATHWAISNGVVTL